MSTLLPTGMMDTMIKPNGIHPLITSRKIYHLCIKILVVLVTTILMVLSTIPLFPTSELTSQNSFTEFEAYMNERIPTIMAAYQIPGATIAIVKDYEILWSNAYGYADLASKTAMSIETPMRVQSISKSITAWGVMKLVKDGLLDLDAPVTQYLKTWVFPPSEFDIQAVTARLLLTHTAGLPIGDFYNFYSPTDEIPTLRESLFNEAVLLKEPGQSFYYSNVGFNLLELIIEDVTGYDFNEYMTSEILLPLEMHASNFTWSETFDPPVPTGYNLAGKPIPVYVYPEKGSGGLFAPVEDIAQFVIAEMQSESYSIPVLSPFSINSMHQPMVHELGMYSLVFDGYGFGHYIEVLPDKNVSISHGGQGTGWMTHFQAVPQTGDGIVILTNSQRSWPLIAYLLSDWASWNALPDPGMQKIILGIRLLAGITSILWFAFIWIVSSFLINLYQKSLIFSPLSRKSRSRSISIILSITIIGVLLWSAMQDYLFLTSVFPISAIWLGTSSFSLAMMNLISNLFVVKQTNRVFSE